MDTEKTIKVMKKIPFLNDTEERYLFELVKRLKVVSFKKNATIFEKGDEGVCMYIVLSGKVDIYNRGSNGNEVIHETLTSTEIIDEMSLLDGFERSAYARAAEDTVLFKLDRNDFFDFLRKNQEVAIKVIIKISAKLRQINMKNMESSEAFNKMSSISFDTLESHYNHYNISELSIPEEDIKKMLYQKEYVCPICENKITTSHVRSSSMRIKKVDDDLCSHYENINPIYYEIIVCPQCGYAFNEDTYSIKINDQQKEEILKQIEPLWKYDNFDYSGTRTIEQSIQAYHLFALSIKNLKMKNSKRGNAFLKIAWLYRFKNEASSELKYLHFAVDRFKEAYSKENIRDPKLEMNIIYLLGVLNLKLGNKKEGAKWLDIILRHPAREMLPGIVERARDIWQGMKQQ
ncbi:DUF2225 domain-containing protein [Pelotomaculum terephthalicicum JT]|uniref:DUF2225 domain-containing protein n=1 Tax=Pelotomaculum terephthalicicum TaxID=206393 RepID=UPI0009CF58D7|nr:DUF2225 domain-containing protein [Pelotomaculum terephthalicicum]MCG9968622.1 DUF2225 domain-containing protein [Pelotomaculum terephthalicicum JT]OPY62601.1 MAG: cAMP receptor protein [Pelotomaculum sp. PtaU1.Bin065]